MTEKVNWRIEINLYDSQMSLLDTEVFWAPCIGTRVDKIMEKWPNVYQAIISMKKGEADENDR